MTNLRVCVVGLGFMGNTHIDAIRRIPFTEVVAVVDNDIEKASVVAEIMGIPNIYQSFESALENVSFDIVHICAPNEMHFSICKSALTAGIDVFCEKPLCNTLEEADDLKKIVDNSTCKFGVNFIYRMNPMVQEIHARISEHEWGRKFLVHGRYIQDWLLYDTDFNWRCLSEIGGVSRAVADIGSHWIDLAQFITGQRIVRVMAKLITLHDRRKKLDKPVETYGSGQDGLYEWVPIDTEDAAIILLQFADGIYGNLILSQVAAGSKNELVIRVDGTHESLTWKQETPDRLFIGSRDSGTTSIYADRSMLRHEAAEFGTIPAGHTLGWKDMLTESIRRFYESVRNRHLKTGYATFYEAYYNMKVGAACIRSSKNECWEEV